MGPSLIFAYFSPYVSTFLRVPCSTFSAPAAQVSLSKSWLYPLSSIRRYCQRGMPGMSSPSTHNRQSTMKVHVRACADGFPQQGEFQRQVCHWYTETWSELLADVYLKTFPRPLNANRWRLEAKFRPQISPLLLIMTSPGEPFLCMGWHAGMMLTFRTIHAALDFMKRCILVFLLVEPENVCRNPRISEIEKLSLHLHAPFFSCTHAPIFKFYSVEMIDDVHEILLHFMDLYLQNTKSWGDRWRLSYILAVSWEA